MMLKRDTISARRIIKVFLFAAALITPMTAAAYLRPEEVLMNDAYLAPPTPREASLYQAEQMRKSARLREAEWEAEYARQHPPEPEVVEIEEDAHAAAEESGLSDLELLRTIRLLERVDARQDVLEDFWTLPTMHQGAPLSPTGPASVLAAVTMLSAMGWTLKNAGKKRGWRKKAL